MDEYMALFKAVIGGSTIFTGLYFYRKHVRELRQKAIEDFTREMGFSEVSTDKDGHPTFLFKLRDSLFTMRQFDTGGRNNPLTTTVQVYLPLDINQRRHSGIKSGRELLFSFQPEATDAFSYDSLNSVIHSARNAIRSVGGIQDIEIGDSELDKALCIKGISEDFVKKIFHKELIAQTKALYKIAPFSLVVTGDSVEFKRMDHALDADYYKALTILMLSLIDTIQSNCSGQ